MMTRWSVALLVASLTLGAIGSRLAAQEPAKPGPEHEALKRLVGDWDCTIHMQGAEFKGTANYKLGYGGFWITEHFNADFGGMKFEGRGTTGYDPNKKKYITTWIDSMTPKLMIMEGTMDKDAKTFTETGEGTGMDGKPAKFKSVSEYKDNDTINFTMYTVANGKEQEMMKINYTRKK
jgi:Protein of unknown function (DUF1579)